MVTPDQIRERLRAVEDPDLEDDIVSLGLVSDVRIEAGVAAVSVAFNAPLSPVEWEMCDEIRALCRGIGLEPRLYAVGTPDSDVFERVKNTIAIASVDADAGGDRVTTHLATVLAERDARVGIFDLCSSGRHGTWLETVDPPDCSAEPIVPTHVRGVSVVALGPHLPDGESVPAATTVLELALPRLLEALEWEPLDYLFVLLPTGTGQRPRVVLERVPTDGAVVVSSTETDPARIRETGQTLTTLGETVLGVLQTVDEYGVDVDSARDDIALSRDDTGLDLGADGDEPNDDGWWPNGPEFESPVFDTTPPGRGEDVFEPEQFQTLAASIIDRIGAVNRQSAVERRGT